MNLSFAGCGFLGIYHVGVASCFREYAPHVLVNKIAGASAGALAACTLLCGSPLGASTSDVLRIVMKARSRALGPFHPGFDLNRILYDSLNRMLPEDAHLRCNGHLHISCTRVSDGKNVLLNQFDSKDDLIQALLCSSFIPFYSGIMPLKFHGVAYMDGGLSDNLPILDDCTVTVSPFSGESDICPQDNYINFLQINIANTSIAMSPSNLYRMTRILFPPPPEILSKMCQQGFDDALRFLQRNNMISCTRCLAVQSSFVMSEMENEPEDVAEVSVPNEIEPLKEPEEHEYDGCADCKNKQQLALCNGLPDAVTAVIQDACDELNKGVINWLFRHRPVKLLSLLTIPYVLPIDITIVAFCKLLELVPMVRKELQHSFWNLVGFAKMFLSKFDKNRHLYSAKFSCQLAVTEYNYSKEEEVVTYNSRAPSRRCSRVASPLPSITRNDRSHSLEEIGCLPYKVQRKSYAGTSNVPTFRHTGPRRISLADKADRKSRSERVISSMNFGFTMDLSQRKRKLAAGCIRDKRRSLMEAFESLDNQTSEVDMIEIANRALNMEREYLHRSQTDLLGESPGIDTFEHILEVTDKQEALMAYYYLDENNRVKVTEIFNVTDADTSAVLAPEEREANENLQWDFDWKSSDLTLVEDFELCPRISSRKALEACLLDYQNYCDNSLDSVESSTDLSSSEVIENNFFDDLGKKMTREDSFLIAEK